MAYVRRKIQPGHVTTAGSFASAQAEGGISEVVAFSDFRPGNSQAQGEQHMASTLMEAAGRHPNALAIALMGNFHTSKKVTPLPAAQTISLFAIDKGGEAWNQMEDGCRPHRLPSTGGNRRGITLSETAAPLPGFDGVASTGLAATASRPAYPNAPPPPVCGIPAGS